jgi:hypothetical protein
VDPTAVAGMAIAAVVRYLGHRARGVAERKLVDPQLERLYDAVRRRVAAAPAKGRVLEELEADPDDPRRQARLEYALELEIDGDPAYAQQLAGLLEKLPAREIGEVHIESSGAVALMGDVNISGEYAAGRDQVFGRRPR